MGGGPTLQIPGAGPRAGEGIQSILVAFETGEGPGFVRVGEGDIDTLDLFAESIEDLTLYLKKKPAALGNVLLWPVAPGLCDLAGNAAVDTQQGQQAHVWLNLEKAVRCPRLRGGGREFEAFGLEALPQGFADSAWSLQAGAVGSAPGCAEGPGDLVICPTPSCDGGERQGHVDRDHRGSVKA